MSFFDQNPHARPMQPPQDPRLDPRYAQRPGPYGPYPNQPYPQPQAYDPRMMPPAQYPQDPRYDPRLDPRFDPRYDPRFDPRAQGAVPMAPRQPMSMPNYVDPRMTRDYPYAIPSGMNRGMADEYPNAWTSSPMNKPNEGPVMANQPDREQVKESQETQSQKKDKKEVFEITSDNSEMIPPNKQNFKTPEIEEEESVSIYYTDHESEIFSLEEAAHYSILGYQKSDDDNREENSLPIYINIFKIGKSYFDKKNIKCLTQIDNFSSFVTNCEEEMKNTEDPIVFSYLYDLVQYLTDYTNNFLKTVYTINVSIDNILQDYKDLVEYLREKHPLLGKRLVGLLMSILSANKNSAEEDLKFVRNVSMTYVDFTCFSFQLYKITKDQPYLITNTKNNYPFINLLDYIFRGLQEDTENYKSLTEHYILTRDNKIYRIYNMGSDTNMFFIQKA